MGCLQSIVNEYDDKIRDCTMRLEGMAMATQLVSSMQAKCSAYLAYFLDYWIGSNSTQARGETSGDSIGHGSGF